MELTEYAVPLDQAELLEVAQRLVALSRDRDAAAKLFAELSAEHKAKIKELNGLIKGMMEILTTERELRQVPLMICFNEPEPGKKTLKNAESGRIYEVLDIEPGDLDDLFSAQAIRSSTPEAEEAEEAEEVEEAEEADGSLQFPIPLYDASVTDRSYLKLEAGKWYHYEGVTARAVTTADAPDGCMYCPYCCEHWADCGDGIVFRTFDWSSDDNTEWCKRFKRERGIGVDPEPQEECAYCHDSADFLYHISDEAPVCQKCLDEKSEDHQRKAMGLVRAAKESGKEVLFRMDWGADAVKKKDLTRFRFRSDKGGWGMLVYFPGMICHPQSPAAYFYKKLIQGGAKED